MSETSRPRLPSVDIGAEVVVAKGKLQGKRGTVVSKKVGWYKVQVAGVEEVGSFRLTDLSSEETANPPYTKTQPPPSSSSPLKSKAPPSPLKDTSASQSPLKNVASQSPLKKKAPSSPLNKNAFESPLKRNARSSPLKGGNNASPSPASRAAVAVTAGTPGRRVAVSRGSGLPPRCPSSTPAGESAVTGLLSLRRSFSGGGTDAATAPEAEALRPQNDRVSAPEGGADAEGGRGRGAQSDVSSLVTDAGGKEAVGEGEGGREGVDREDTEVEDSGGEETETDMEMEAGEELSGEKKKSEQEGKDGMDLDGGDTEGEEKKEEEEEEEEEEEDEEVDIEAMVKLAAAAARKHALALTDASRGGGKSSASTASIEGNAGARKRPRGGGGRAPTALDTGLLSPKYLRYAGGGKRESLTASVASDAVGGSKAAKLMAASSLYSGRDRAMLLERSKAPKDDTAGKGWFNMEQAEMTPELKRDLQVIRMRNYVDPKRFYKASDKVSKFMQIGTVKEGAAEFFSSRMTNKERKTTLVDELLVADDAFRAYSKNQYSSIQSRKRAGGKAQYNEQRRKRKGGMKWKP